MKQTKKIKPANYPNLKALGELLDRYRWFMAKRELERRNKQLKSKKRAASINVKS